MNTHHFTGAPTMYSNRPTAATELARKRYEQTQALWDARRRRAEFNDKVARAGVALLFLALLGAGMWPIVADFFKIAPFH